MKTHIHTFTSAFNSIILDGIKDNFKVTKFINL